ncbi:AGE family epimerase/isomerase [Affinirhizobium pseudoryzae]|uniref:AGE family epimerase/isomerase n=1 Tax=Allorhizobium pseudoryzae TaxID=379684 RepID=UPI0013E9F8F0|nr:AGE family epimerase/isomerase [Allorhizobium pseudoryzae]
MSNRGEFGDIDSGIIELAGEARSWLFGAANFWTEVGRSHGMFAEKLSYTGSVESCNRRTFVQGRHIYSVCMAGRLGWEGPWRSLVEETLDILLRRARRSNGLFVHSLTCDGQIADPRVDLYDQAFMLFMLAHAADVLQRNELIDIAADLTDTLQREWQLPEGGFFEGEITPAGIRLQNPHMHLLEAFIALHNVSGRERFLALAEDIVGLCENFFVDQKSGGLLEYFDRSLCPVDGDKGSIVEPGHCFEWAWLLEKARFSSDSLHTADMLTHFGRTWGIDRSRNVAVNEVYTDGKIRNATARLWPQTERMKVALVRYLRKSDPVEAEEVKLSYLGLRQYLNKSDGIFTWRDKLDPEGNWVKEPAPGSSLYHIVCAYNELIIAANAGFVDKHL